MIMKLRELYIKGFKSIDGEHGATIPFGDVTVLLGANGAGKSNAVSAFHLLQSIARQELRQFVSKQGVSSLLFYGPKKTCLLYTSKVCWKIFSANLTAGLTRLYCAFSPNYALAAKLKSAKTGMCWKKPIWNTPFATRPRTAI